MKKEERGASLNVVACGSLDDSKKVSKWWASKERESGDKRRQKEPHAIEEFGAKTKTDEGTLHFTLG